MGPIYDAFYNAKITAANVPQPGEQGSYTMSAFLEDFPQFCLEHKTIGNEETQRKCLVPESVLQVFVEQANDSYCVPLGKYVEVCGRALCGTFFGYVS